MVKRNFGLILIVILALIPVLIWLFMEPLSLRFENAGLFFTSIGQISGLAGMAFFSLVLFLNTRIKFLDKIFNGINNAYVSHHNLGAIAFSLLLLHPVSLVIKSIFVSLPFAFNFLVTSDWITIAGEAGLLVMMFSLFVTFFTKVAYEKWKFTHKFLTVAFIISSLHVYFVSSDISASGLLRTYMLILIVFGYFAVMYRTFFEKSLVKKFNYTVDYINQISDSLAEVIMSPQGEVLKFKPGQFIFVNFNDTTVGRETHPFTISSSPNEKELKIAVKALGDFTSRLKLLKKGTSVSIEGPFGNFSYLNYSKNLKQIWIAGGIGVTPFLSMARSLNSQNEYDIDLYYCVNSRQELAFFDELEEIARNINRFKINSFCSDEKGRITAEIINKESKGVNNSEIFICGPFPMMKSLKEQFLKLGINEYNIHIEEFKMY